MTSLAELNTKESITTGEAAVAAKELVAKYLRVLGNVLDIKTNVSEDEASFFQRRRRALTTEETEGASARRSSNTELLQELQRVLQELEANINKVERYMIKKRASF
ncbi:MAG: hypothetical protein CMF50_07815 [Legionellales bacterium]|nr:hypothetical protein [Legionellales bacterium]|tara:strand:- start:11059 stop:11376 length:318 start_codon:yes stop_codon:yes gene_type:complete